MVKKILLADVCLSNELIRMLRRNDMTVLEVKKVKDPSAKFLPMNAKPHGWKPWGDTEILDFARAKDMMIITADRGLARRHPYAILVSANCQKPSKIQLEQAIEQYGMVKNGNQLRHMKRTGMTFPMKDTHAVFTEAFNTAFIMNMFE